MHYRIITVACLVTTGALFWLLAPDPSSASRPATSAAPIPQSVSALRSNDSTVRSHVPVAAVAPSIANQPGRTAPPDQVEVPKATQEHRPDDLSQEEREERSRERTVLTERWTRQEHELNPEAQELMIARLETALTNDELDLASLKTLDCRRSICRLELVTVGTGSASLAEVQGLIHAIRQLPETWLLATETRPGAWTVEAFASIEGYTLTGDRTE